MIQSTWWNDRFSVRYSGREKKVQSRLCIGLLAFLSIMPALGNDLETSFEFNDTDGEFTLGTSPKSVTFTGGEAKSIGVLALYNSGIRSWMIDDGKTGTITFETPAAEVTLFFRDQDAAVKSVLTFFDTSNQVIQTPFNGIPTAWTEVSLSTEGDGIPPIGSITLQNPGSTGYAVIDDFSFSAAQLPQLTNKIFFAQFGNGDGFTSDLVLANPSTTEMVSGRVDFFDDEGLPLPVGIADVRDTGAVPFGLAPADVLSSVVFSIAPLDAVTISTDGLGGVVVGSAVVSSDNVLGGVIRFTVPNIGVAGVGASTPLTGFIAPMRRQSGGINTGIAILNTDIDSETLQLKLPVTLNLTLLDSQGQEVPNGAKIISDFPVAGHLAQFINELFPDAETDDFQGTLVVEVSDGNVAATALELGSQSGQFTTLPVTPLE